MTTVESGENDGGCINTKSRKIGCRLFIILDVWASLPKWIRAIMHDLYNETLRWRLLRKMSRVS